MSRSFSMLSTAEKSWVSIKATATAGRPPVMRYFLKLSFSRLKKMSGIVSILFIASMYLCKPPSTSCRNSEKLRGCTSRNCTFPTGKELPFPRETPNNEPADITCRSGIFSAKYFKLPKAGRHACISSKTNKVPTSILEPCTRERLSMISFAFFP